VRKDWGELLGSLSSIYVRLLSVQFSACIISAEDQLQWLFGQLVLVFRRLDSVTVNWVSFIVLNLSFCCCFSHCLTRLYSDILFNAESSHGGFIYGYKVVWSPIICLHFKCLISTELFFKIKTNVLRTQFAA